MQAERDPQGSKKRNFGQTIEPIITRPSTNVVTSDVDATGALGDKFAGASSNGNTIGGNASLRTPSRKLPALQQPNHGDAIVPPPTPTRKLLLSGRLPCLQICPLERRPPHSFICVGFSNRGAPKAASNIDAFGTTVFTNIRRRTT